MSKPVVAITRPKDRAKKACEIVENRKARWKCNSCTDT